MSDEAKIEELEDEEVVEQEPELDELEAMILGEEPEEEESSEEEELPEELAEEQSEESEEENSEEEDNRESTEETEEERIEEKPETDEKPADNKSWAKLRHEAKKAKALEAELERLKNPPAQNESASSAVEKIVKVWDSGEGNDKPMMATVRNSTSKELVAIYQDAQSGKYGEHSDDVISMIQKELPMVQARESQSAQDAQANREAILKEFEEERKMADQDFPELAGEDTDGAKFLNEFTEKLAGKLDDSGKHDGEGELPEELALYLHSHPYVARQLADRVFKAQSQGSEASKGQMAKLSKELEATKKRLAKYESPANPSAGKSAKDPVADSMDELEKLILS